MDRGKPSAKRRFTLLELLIVITILMVLMGMLLPALNQARAKGKQASCTNRLKQITIALQYYVTDREGFMVYDEQDPINLPGEMWHQKLRDAIGETVAQPVVDNSNFFQDPGVSGEFYYSLTDPLNVAASHYMYNDQVNGVRMVNVENTAETMSIFDGSNKIRIGGSPQLIDGTLLFPHPSNKANVLYVDGHVSVSNADSTPTDPTDWFWKP